MRTLKRFKKDDRGTTAVIFSLALLPILAGAFAAVDYGRAINVQADLQAAVDAAALQAVSTRKPGESFNAGGTVAGLYRNRLTPNAPQVQGAWSGASSYTVSAQVPVPTTVIGLLIPTMNVTARATAQAVWRFTRTEIEGFNMSPEAADYNELYAYCYNEKTRQRLGPVDPASIPADGSMARVRRLDFQKIADNSDAGVARRPANLSVICGPDEVASYHLRNVRNARLDPSRQGPEAVNHNRPCGETVSHSRFGETWRHYTDSTLATNAAAGALPQFNTCYRDLVETIVCDRREDCLTRAMGGSGTIPDFMPKNRTPATASRACAPDRFIYFGWEDRPPGIGQWTDRDYDDIRLTVRCPQDLTPVRGPARLTS